MCRYDDGTGRLLQHRSSTLQPGPHGGGFPPKNNNKYFFNKSRSFAVVSLPVMKDQKPSGCQVGQGQDYRFRFFTFNLANSGCLRPQASCLKGDSTDDARPRLADRGANPRRRPFPET